MKKTCFLISSLSLLLLLSTTIAQAQPDTTPTGTTTIHHDCNTYCSFGNCTAIVHDTEHENPDGCTNYFESGVAGVVPGEATCRNDWRDGSTTRINCQRVGDFGVCSLSGLIRCPQPGGGTALRGYSFGCTGPANGAMPIAGADRTGGACSDGPGLPSQILVCGSNGNAWVGTYN